MFFFHMDKPQETSGFYMCARLLASAPALEQFKRRPTSTGKDWDSRHHHHLVGVVVVVDQSRRGRGASKPGSAAGSHHGRPFASGCTMPRSSGRWRTYRLSDGPCWGCSICRGPLGRMADGIQMGIRMDSKKSGCHWKHLETMNDERRTMWETLAMRHFLLDFDGLPMTYRLKAFCNW